jgi:hypothetical protein
MTNFRPLMLEKSEGAKLTLRKRSIRVTPLSTNHRSPLCLPYRTVVIFKLALPFASHTIQTSLSLSLSLSLSQYKFSYQSLSSWRLVMLCQLRPRSRSIRLRSTPLRWRRTPQTTTPHLPSPRRKRRKSLRRRSLESPVRLLPIRLMLRFVFSLSLSLSLSLSRSLCP